MPKSQDSPRKPVFNAAKRHYKANGHLVKSDFHVVSYFENGIIVQYEKIRELNLSKKIGRRAKIISNYNE